MEKKTRITLSERDLRNLIMVLEWGLSGYEDEKNAKELEKLEFRLKKAYNKL